MYKPNLPNAYKKYIQIIIIKKNEYHFLQKNILEDITS